MVWQVLVIAIIAYLIGSINPSIILSKLLGSLQSPITNFARVIKQIAEKGGEIAEAPAEAVAETPAE